MRAVVTLHAKTARAPRTSMAIRAALTIEELHAARMVIAPSIKTEGTIDQLAQQTPG